MSSSNIILRLFAVVGLAFIMLGGSGCSTQNGEYASVKQQWDTPRSSDTEDSLRTRLAYTQRDN